MRFSLDKALGIHPEALGLRAKRMEVLANNLANADTPNFKARDVDFKAALGRASKSNHHMAMERTNPGHLGGSESAMSADLKYRIPLQPSADGNTVDTQMEISAFAENALRYQASLNFLTGRVRSLLSAIKGE